MMACNSNKVRADNEKRVANTRRMLIKIWSSKKPGHTPLTSQCFSVNFSKDGSKNLSGFSASKSSFVTSKNVWNRVFFWAFISMRLFTSSATAFAAVSWNSSDSALAILSFFGSFNRYNNLNNVSLPRKQKKSNLGSGCFGSKSG